MGNDRRTTRLSDAMAKSVDEWRRHQTDIPTRSESIRRLVFLGIGAEPILRDLLAMMEGLPQNADLDRHIRSVRLLVEPDYQSQPE